MGRVFATLAVAMVGLALSPAPIQAEESIENLLKSYRKEADLSKQTKKENAGFVVVYTRDDMERMQIYRLSDILKAMRFIRYNINDYGMTDPIHIDPFFYSSDVIKVYVNDHEITSGFSGSGLQFYGNVDMGMFDHVEVYYDAPVLDVATEPSAIVIKLYTKTPERENGGSVVGRLGDRGTQEIALSHARDFGEWSYFAYAEEAENNFKKARHEVLGQSYELSRDYGQQHLYLDLHKKSQRLELEYLGQKHDPFSGQSMYVTGARGDWEQPMYRASYSADILDETLHFDLSYIHSSLDFDMSVYGPFWGQMLFESNNSVIYFQENHFKFKVDGDLFTAKSYYEKTFWENHLVKVGVEYRYKDAEVTRYRFNSLRIPDKDAHMHIGSVYVQDQVSVLSNAMLSASLKYNYFDFKRHSELNGDEGADLGTWQGRLAFSSIWDAWHVKAFLSHVEFPTQLYVLVMHDHALDSQKLNGISGEIKHLGNKTDVRLFLSYSWMEDFILLQASDPAHNVTTDVRRFNASFDYTYRFSPDHRFEFNINWSKFYDDETTNRHYSKDNYLAGYARLLDTFGNIDLFNEIIYRESTPVLDAGWDYSAGVIYHATDDLSIAFKAVNILDEAQESNFVYTNPIQGQGITTLPVYGKQFYLSMEWLF